MNGTKNSNRSGKTISQRDVKKVLKAGGIPDSLSNKFHLYLTTAVKIYSEAKGISKGLLTRKKKKDKIDAAAKAARKLQLELSKSTAPKQLMIIYEALQCEQQVGARSQDSELHAKENFSRAADLVTNDLAAFDRLVDRMEKTRKGLEQEPLDYDEVVAAKSANKQAMWLLAGAIETYWSDNLGREVSSSKKIRFLPFAREVFRIAGDEKIDEISDRALMMRFKNH